MMDVYIPIANCQTVEESILNKLSSEPLVDNVWIHPTQEYVPRENSERHRIIFRNWLQIFEMAIARGKDYFMLCNSNNMKFIHKIPLLWEYMTKVLGCGLVAYNPYKTKKHPRHVAIGLSLIRTRAIKDVTFSMGEYKFCGCMAICNGLREKEWEVNYVGELVKPSKEKRK